jgi:hypothetical protein
LTSRSCVSFPSSGNFKGARRTAEAGDELSPATPARTPHEILESGGGEQLAELMIDHSIGCTTAVNHAVKRIDSDYFSEAE